jgi:hypothetical protein
MVARDAASQKVVERPIEESVVEMMLNIPEELAAELHAMASELPRILRLGMREIRAESDGGFAGLSSVFEILATLPSPQEVMALRPSAQLDARITELLEKNRTTGLNPEEKEEWKRYEYVEHLVRMAKGRARGRLAEGSIR